MGNLIHNLWNGKLGNSTFFQEACPVIKNPM
jgi:hypothetical protein